MAHTVVKNILLDSSKNAIVYLYIQSDGMSPDLSNFVLLDPKTDFVDSPMKVQMTVTQVWHSFSWFDGFLSFNDTVPYPSWVLTRDTVNYQDFRFFGGLKDKSDIDGTGQLLFSTNGLTTAGNLGTIIVEVRKNNPMYSGNITPNLPSVWPLQAPASSAPVVVN